MYKCVCFQICIFIYIYIYIFVYIFRHRYRLSHKCLVGMYVELLDVRFMPRPSCSAFPYLLLICLPIFCRFECLSYAGSPPYSYPLDPARASPHPYWVLWVGGGAEGGGVN